MERMPLPQRTQWLHLIALTGAHFVLDTFPGLMHTVLPAFQTSFGLSVAAGGILLTAFLIASNGIQVIIGHLNPNRDRPLFLYAGLLLTCLILLYGVVPSGQGALIWLMLIATAAGAGVGMTHPEALKAVHRLDGISSAAGSTIFMGGGVFGFAFGGWASTHLFERWGMTGLIPFCAASIGVLVLLMLLGVRLAIESDSQAPKKAAVQSEPVAFWLILAIGMLIVSSVQVLMWIVPQHISQMGAELAVGGRTVSLFTLAGGLGGIVMARFAVDGRELKTIIAMLAAGLPFVIGYVLLLQQSWAWLLLCGGGFFCFGAYPLTVSAARSSQGPNLGRRMGFIVGGVWLFACMLPMLLGPVADHFGTRPILFCSPAGFVLSLALAVVSRKKPRISTITQAI